MCSACPVCDDPDASHPNTHWAFSWYPSIGLWRALSCEQALSGCPDNTMGRGKDGTWRGRRDGFQGIKMGHTSGAVWSAPLRHRELCFGMLLAPQHSGESEEARRRHNSHCQIPEGQS